jgi:hypothetical protein
MVIFFVASVYLTLFIVCPFRTPTHPHLHIHAENSPKIHFSSLQTFHLGPAKKSSQFGAAAVGKKC